MNIIDNRKRGCEFRCLRVGDYFMVENNLYLTIDDVVAEDNVCDDYEDSDIMNAVNLTNGFLGYFNGFDIVEPVDVEITVS